MRKISKMAAEAFHAGKNWKMGNTEVFVEGEITALMLHGNIIAKRFPTMLMINLCGYPTVTTRERLNALDGVSIRQHKGEQLLKVYDDERVIESLGWYSVARGEHG